MASLAKNLRKQLENAVKKARRVAEKGARSALEELAIADARTPRSVREDERKRSLRERLRAHGKQLGDKRDAEKETWETGRLASEVAYEHWHRLLFARFLAENDLLIEPSSNIAVSIDEVRELAREKNVDWIDLAAGWAQRMLPRIFRGGDPVLEVALPPEARLELEEIVEELPREVFLADDALGWVYQFWQAERKDEINARGDKIGAGELSAVTQLFTEDYMVLFLLHNTLGAWWAGNVLARNPKLAITAVGEDELRAACAVGEIDWTYLRFVRSDEGTWRPAAGTFDGWPRRVREIRLLDPCMGSGHFLVFALPILAAMRMEEESLSKHDAMLAVLRDNLHGLELDPRCTQIAAFNLALATWKAIGYEPAMPRLRLACSGLSIAASEKEWIDLTGGDSPWSGTMGQLYALFKQAPALGSLIDPRRVFGELFETTFEKVRPSLEKALAKEHAMPEEDELAISAQGLLDAAEFLTSRYTLVATNVPYLKRGQQDVDLRGFADIYHVDTKGDIATMFIDRLMSIAESDGTVAIVSPQSWFYQPTYRRMRRKFLQITEWCCTARLGTAAFESVSGEVVNVALTVLAVATPSPASLFACFDVTAAATASAKSHLLLHVQPSTHSQLEQLQNPEHRVITAVSDSNAPLLAAVAKSHKGITTNDDHHFVRFFWEQDRLSTSDDWEPFQSTVAETMVLGGTERIVLYERGKGAMRELARSQDRDRRRDFQGVNAWGRPGVAVSCTGSLPVSLYLQSKFDTNVAVITPNVAKDLLPILSFCQSPDFSDRVRRIDPSLKVTNATLVKIPFERADWDRVAKEKFPNGLEQIEICDERQIVFRGHPQTSLRPLSVGVCRLLGYAWPRQTGSSFPLCSEVGEDQLQKHADHDGIVCLPLLKDDATASERLVALLADAFGGDWSPAMLMLVLNEVGYTTAEAWLRDAFFTQHCELFHQRPFIWQLWDGVKDGFSTLVNYHKLAAPNGEGRKTLEKLRYSYLGDWIERQRAYQKRGVEGSDLKLAAAEHLARELEKILEGEPPYDIFVRWKPLHEQPIGWEPDINDGVRINIRPFMMARPYNAKARNVSILRATPNVKWGKDSGKEPTRPKDDYPWFWGWDEKTVDFPGGSAFDGNRWNDLHYNRAFKARRRAKQKGSL